MRNFIKHTKKQTRVNQLENKITMCAKRARQRLGRALQTTDANSKSVKNSETKHFKMHLRSSLLVFFPLSLGLLFLTFLFDFSRRPSLCCPQYVSDVSFTQFIAPISIASRHDFHISHSLPLILCLFH